MNKGLTMVKFVKRYNPESVLKDKDVIYVFGDNLIKKGHAGQATIRDCPNAIGIPTKRLPNMDEGAFFSDKQDEREAIDKALLLIEKEMYNGKDIVIPEDGLGTGMAQMKERSPFLFKYLDSRIRRWSLTRTNHRMGLLYAGIGSRKTPQRILDIMGEIAITMEVAGYVLRSGGADGADNAFAKKVRSENKEIFLPWKGFNDLDSFYVGASKEAEAIAESFHPAWERCSAAVRKLHARNVHQVLGWNLMPESYSKFVVCWTPNAKMVGGTATAIKISLAYGIPVFNLADDLDLTNIKDMVSRLKEEGEKHDDEM